MKLKAERETYRLQAEQFKKIQALQKAIKDIDPADKHLANYGPHRKRQIRDLNNHEARSTTRLKKCELCRLFRLSNLPAISHMENRQGHSYHMTREENFN